MFLLEVEEPEAAKVPRGNLGRTGRAESGGKYADGDNDRGGAHRPIIICGNGAGYVAGVREGGRRGRGMGLTERPTFQWIRGERAKNNEDRFVHECLLK